MAIIRTPNPIPYLNQDGFEIIRNEAHFSKIFCEYLKSTGFDKVLKEIQCYCGSRFIDVVYLDREKGFICCELKMTDWKEAIKQCCDIKQFYPNVYLVMPLQNHYRMGKIRKEVEKHGLGFYTYADKKFREEYKPTGNICHTENLYTGFEIDKMAEELANSIFDSFHFHFLMRCVEWEYGKKVKITVEEQ